MSRLKKLEPIVEISLRKGTRTRTDDFILYLDVIDNFIDTDMTIRGVLEHHKELGLPSFESVTRCRRKLCEKYPELKVEKMEEIRNEETKEYVDYARDKD